MPEVRSHGVALHWEQRGQGRPVLLIHGFSENLERVWGEPGWIDDLVDAGRRVVAFDLRGHGRSERPHAPEDYAIERLVDDVAAVADAAQLHAFDLLGYSLGAELSLRYLTHPDVRDVGRAACISVGLASLRPRRKATALSLEAVSTDDLSHMHRAFPKFRQLLLDRGNDLEMARAFLEAEMIRPPLDPDAVARIDRPVLFVSGEDDWMVGDAQPIADLIEGARVERVPDRDHDNTVHDPRTRAFVLPFLLDAQA